MFKCLPLLLLSLLAYVEGQCPSGWTAWETSCYKYPGLNLTRNDAHYACMNIDNTAHLVFINSLEENSYIRYFEFQTIGNVDRWLGLYRQNAFTEWLWIQHEQSPYRNWAPGQPAGGSICAVIQAGLDTWASADCNVPRNFICEISNVDTGWVGVQTTPKATTTPKQTTPPTTTTTTTTPTTTTTTTTTPTTTTTTTTTTPTTTTTTPTSTTSTTTKPSTTTSTTTTTPQPTTSTTTTTTLSTAPGDEGKSPTTSVKTQSTETNQTVTSSTPIPPNENKNNATNIGRPKSDFVVLYACVGTGALILILIFILIPAICACRREKSQNPPSPEAQPEENPSPYYNPEVSYRAPHLDNADVEEIKPQPNDSVYYNALPNNKRSEEIEMSPSPEPSLIPPPEGESANPIIEDSAGIYATVLDATRPQPVSNLGEGTNRKQSEASVLSEASAQPFVPVSFTGMDQDPLGHYEPLKDGTGYRHSTMDIAEDKPNNKPDRRSLPVNLSKQAPSEISKPGSSDVGHKVVARKQADGSVLEDLYAVPMKRSELGQSELSK